MARKLTAEEVKSMFEPRKAHWYEASFIIALLPAILGGALASIWGGKFGEIVGSSYSASIIILPLALIASVVLSSSYRTRETILLQIQAVMACAEGLKSHLARNPKLKEAYLTAAFALGKFLRAETRSNREMRGAVRALHNAFGPEKTASGNGVIARFSLAYLTFGSQQIRTTPKAVIIAFVIFLVMAIVSVVFSRNMGVTFIMLGLIYSLSGIVLVSVNMVRVLGTRGSQYRVSELISSLLDGVEDESN